MITKHHLSFVPVLVLFLPVVILFSGAGCLKTRPAAVTAGAYHTGIYPDLFNKLLAKGASQVGDKIETAFKQLFYGNDSTQRIYYPVEPDMAYIKDIIHNDVRSEGMSYGMMIAVQLDKKIEFDRIWKWAKTYMQHPHGPRKNYFAWHCRTDGAILDSNSAADGEEWFVTALFFAAARWGEGDGIYRYRREAQAVLDAMVSKENNSDRTDVITNMFNKQERQVVFVPVGNADDFTDPSYHLPHFYEVWAHWADSLNQFWCEAAAASRTFLKKAAHTVTGLTPDYARFDGTPTDPPWGGEHYDFRYDAWRVAMNVAVDYSWFARDEWAVTQSDRLLGFFLAQGIGTYANLYTLDGKPLSTDRSSGLIAMNAVAALAATHPQRKDFVQELWDLSIPSGFGRYYDGMLYMLAMLQVSGNFKLYKPAGGPVMECSGCSN
jgi:oligosaccharide reducing-end xylanase